MSLDLTNGDRLDVSPIVERKSNIIKPISVAKPLSTNLDVKPVSQPIAVAPTLSIPTPSLSQTLQSGVQPTQPIGATTMIPRRINIAQAVTPRTLVQTAQPTASTGIIPRTVSPQVAQAQQLAAETGTTPSGTSIPRMASPQAQAGAGAGSGGAAPTESTEETTEEGAKTAGEKTEIPSTTSQEKKKSMLWLVGLVVGGIGGYFMAKNQNKNLLTYSLIGAGVGGGLGYMADKAMAKKSTTTTPATTTATPTAIPTQPTQ